MQGQVLLPDMYTLLSEALQDVQVVAVLLHVKQE